MRNKIVEADLKYISNANLPWDNLRNAAILISGAAGFLPAYMVQTLLYLNETRKLNIKIIGLVRNIQKAQAVFSHYAGNQNLKLITRDVCEDIKIAGPVDYIIHAASKATPQYFSIDPVGTLAPNVIGTGNLLDLAVEKNASGFLFFSTSGVYGFLAPEHYPIKEDCFGALNPMDPASSYLESKRMGENMCIAWMNKYQVPIKVVRPAITYGPGAPLDDGRSFSDFLSNILNYQDIEIYSDGQAIRNFCYIADATLGFFTVLLKGKTGEAYNIATDHEISIIDLANLLVNEVFKSRGLSVVLKKSQARNYLRTNFPRTTVDISKAKALGWELKFSIKEGFRRTVESFA